MLCDVYRHLRINHSIRPNAGCPILCDSTVLLVRPFALNLLKSFPEMDTICPLWQHNPSESFDLLFLSHGIEFSYIGQANIFLIC